MSLILGRIPGERPSLLRAGLGLLNPRRSSKAATRDFLSALRVVKPHAPLVRMPRKNVHTVVFAPTGAGKGVSLVVPWLLTNPDSCVVIDFKGENYKLTAAARRRMGHQVVCLDPWGVVGGTDCLNSIDAIDPESPTAIDDCRSIGSALVFRTGEEKEPHWADRSEQYIAATTAFVACEAPPEKRNLQFVRAILASPAALKDMEAAMAATPHRWEGLYARMGTQLGHASTEEKGSILSTVGRYLSFCDSLAVAKNGLTSSFDPGDLRRKKMTVYLVVPPERIGTQSGLLRLWIDTILRAVVKQGLGEKKLVHFMLDEAAALGRMDQLVQLVDKFRGYSCRAIFIYQSHGQLKECWKDEGFSLLSNASAVYFATQDYATAEQISKRLGNQTVLLEGFNTSTGKNRSRPVGGFTKDGGSDTYTSGESADYKQSARALRTPDEVLRLHRRAAITFLPGTPAILTHLIRFYEENLNPGPIRRAFSAFKVLVLSVLVLAVTVGLTVGLASVERPQPRIEPQNYPQQPKGDFDLFVGEGRGR